MPQVLLLKFKLSQAGEIDIKYCEMKSITLRRYRIQVKYTKPICKFVDVSDVHVGKGLYAYIGTTDKLVPNDINCSFIVKTMSS